MALMNQKVREDQKKKKYDPLKYTPKQIIELEKRDAEEAAKNKEK